MSRAGAWMVGVVVAGLHGLALAQLLAANDIQAPTLQSAPPIYGSLVQAPAPERQLPAEPVKTQTKPKPEPEPAPEPEPRPEPQESQPAAEASPPQPESNAAERKEPTTQQATVIPPRVDAQGRENPPPVYPAAARRAGEQGKVVLAIHIDERGRVTDARVAQSSGYPRLDRAALEAVRHWRYQPARRGGKAIGFDYRQPVVFSLNSHGS